MLRIAIAITFVLWLAACSRNEPQMPYFNDDDLKIDMIQSDELDGNMTYSFEVTNMGKTTVGFLRLSMQFPVLRDGRNIINPFEALGRSMSGDPIRLAQGEKATFDVVAPLHDVFGEDVQFSGMAELALRGYALAGDQAIPFGISGSLGAVLNKY